jgi:DNA mismatch endonuclease (patch repair protein)
MKPEVLVRRLVHKMGFRFRLHRRDLPGTPDLVFPKLHKVIFVHGCFWHQHANCRRSNIPKTREDYWLPKLTRNVKRDRKSRMQLSKNDWKSLVIWECEIKNPVKLEAKIRKFLT